MWRFGITAQEWLEKAKNQGMWILFLDGTKTADETGAYNVEFISSDTIDEVDTCTGSLSVQKRGTYTYAAMNKLIFLKSESIQKKVNEIKRDYKENVLAEYWINEKISTPSTYDPNELFSY